MPTGLRTSTAIGLASAVPVLAFGTSCQVDEDLGFRITQIELDDNSTITLTFSEPLADFEGIDPNDFRLSFASTLSATITYQGMTATYEYTFYEDLAYHLDSYDYYAMRFAFASAARGAANQIVLSAAESIGPACESLAERRQEYEMYSQYYDDSRFDLAIFLHYASGEVPIESEAGSPLADIGADWVRDPDLSFERDGFGFTNLIPPLRIPCP